MTTPIPQPPGIPILGNIFDVDPNNTWTSLNKLAEKYGPICKIKILGQQLVFIASVSLLEEICDEKRFQKCVTGPIVQIRRAVHDALFTAYPNEASWGIAHRIMAPLLSPSAVEATFVGMQETALQLVSKWSKSGADARINLTNDLRRLNLEAATLCLFGEHLNCLDGTEPPVIMAMDNAAGEAVKRPTRPSIVNWLLYQGKFDKDIKTMRDFATEIMVRRKSQQSPPQDMLNALLNAQDPDSGKSLTESQVIDEMVTLLIGPTTAPGVISFALYYMLKTNPQALTKAREEINSVLGSDGQLTYAHLSKLPYCDAIVKESLRLGAPAPGFNIEPLPSATTGPVTLAGGKYEIPANQPMIALLWTANRDASVFPEPESFQPERWLGDLFDKLPAGAKKWFGNGKRECIGKVYASQWLMVTLITLLKEVDFSMADPGYELKMDNGAFNMKPVDFFVRTKSRNA